MAKVYTGRHGALQLDGDTIAQVVKTGPSNLKRC